jgi:hypothetical protein
MEEAFRTVGSGDLRPQCPMERSVYDGLLFEGKKEVPDGLSVLLYTGDVEPF